MAGLADLDVQDDPYDYYRKRLAQCPVWHEPDLDLYVIGGHREARAALMDVDTFSSTPVRKGKPSEAQVAYFRTLSEHGWTRSATLQRTDPPEHTRYRKLLNRIFTPARVRELTPHITDIAASLIDDIAARADDDGTARTEFVADFALPLPGIFIAEQLGLDRTQYRTFRRWADAMLAMANRVLTLDEAIAEAMVEVEAQHFLAAEIERRRAEPTDDLISLLAHAHGDDEEPLTMGELQDLLHQLVTGGFETTTGGLAAAMLLLVEHPDQQQRLRDDPSLIANFVEEALRYDAPVQGLWRRAACPATVAGVDIPEGAAVMMRFAAANRDPAVFDDPDRFDVTRPDARNHVAFGFGNHYCVGAALARQEMQTAFELLLQRCSHIELAEPLSHPLHDPSVFLRPMRRLDLTVTLA
jgi:cytochrome P450